MRDQILVMDRLLNCTGGQGYYDSSAIRDYCTFFYLFHLTSQLVNQSSDNSIYQ